MGAVLQWRKFNFFDVKTYMHPAVLTDAMRDVTVTSCASGHGMIYLGDSKGMVYSIDRQMQINVFSTLQAEVKIILMDDNSKFLITIEGGAKTVSSVKVWSLDRITSQGSPLLLRTICPDTKMENPTIGQCTPFVTAATFFTSGSLLALGYSDGNIFLYKDVHRERGSKAMKLSCTLNGQVTNLHFRSTKKLVHLFATTENNVYSINFNSKDKDYLVELDRGGCCKGCSSLSDSKNEYELLVARDDAIYGYTTDSRTSCYIFDGKKISISWFRTYFVVVSQEEFYSRIRYVLTVYDPVNKLVSLNSEIENYVGTLCEWGGLYILTSTPSLLHISEIDLQSKLDLLFKKNQFDIAISIAKMQYCDEEEVSEILKQYGDWLYDKGNSVAAMEQYIKTIPYLEPSYVIKKFLDTQHIENLATYLQALHKSGNATSNHTTLMLNCYTRLKDLKKLDDFIAENEIDCDIDVAVKVCCGAGFYDHALTLASKYNLHREYLSILMNDKKDFEAALQYLSTLGRSDAKECILEYGSLLMKKHPEEVIQLLVQLCTNTNFNQARQHLQEPPLAANALEDPADFEHLLIGQGEVSISFYERIMETRTLSSSLTTNLITELLHQFAMAPEGQDQTTIEEKILKLLRSDSIKYDRDHILLMCSKYNFAEGKLIIWEQAGMYEDLLEWHAEMGDYKSVLGVCQRHGEDNPHLWASVLRLMTRESSVTSPDIDLLNSVLTKIDEFQLIPPLEITDYLTSSPHLTLGQVRNFLQKMIAAQKSTLSSEVSLFAAQNELLSQTKDSIKSLSSDTIYFTNTKCNICNNKLELPSTHFLCRHSYHKHCLESYSENDDCPLCLPEIKKIRQSVSSQKKSLEHHSVLQEQLDRSTDPFSVIADYIGHGVFCQDSLFPSPSNVSRNLPLNKGKERQKYPASSKDRSASPSVQQAQSIQQHIEYSSLPVRDHTDHSAVKEKEDVAIPSLTVQKVSQSRAPLPDNPYEQGSSGLNPFGEDFEDEEMNTNPFEDNYSESKNPFVEAAPAPDQSTSRKSDNPFDKTDYDASLNPFEES